jgi:GNAT superfamily N-acetyltransferase
MNRPVITSDLARRFEKVWAHFQAARMSGIMELAGNPSGIAIKRFGEATALRSQKAPGNTWFNRVIGLSEHEADQLDGLLAFYRGVGLRGYLELTPGLATEELPRRLSERGAYHCGFHAVTWGTPTTENRAPAPGVQVRPVAQGEVDVFLSALLEGFGVPATIATNMKFWYGAPGWHLYLATVDGVPAGGAVLYEDDGIGYMATASTIPAMRGRGCQTALLNCRIADAARHGCELLMAQCAFGSVSQQNMQRVGMEMAYTKAIWTDAAAPGQVHA